MSVLTAQGVCVTFGSRPVIREVELGVNSGEVMVVLGPNGAGKTTLLSVLSGDLVPDSGRVQIGGRPPADWRAVELARFRAVMVQENRISFGFRVGDVVRMGRSPWRNTQHGRDDDLVVAQALETVDLLHLTYRNYLTLSGGEKARTSFARMLAQQATVLLLDEPTAALDIHHQQAVLSTLRTLADHGRAVVVVMHDLTVAAAHADRVVLLAEGRVRADGPPSAVLTTDILTEVYRHPIDVFPHPVTGAPVVVADSRRSSSSSALGSSTFDRRTVGAADLRKDPA